MIEFYRSADLANGALICLQGFLYLAELPSSPASCRIFVELNSLIHEVSWLVELEAKDARNVAL